MLERDGHTEASADLCRLAGIDPPVGLLCELNKDDGEMMRRDDCRAFATHHGIPIITIDSLKQHLRIAYDERPEITRCITPQKAETGCFTVEEIGSCMLPVTRAGVNLGRWEMKCFRSRQDPQNIHVCLLKGSSQDREAAAERGDLLVRVHSQCLTGDLLGSQRCDCGQQLQRAMETIHADGCGVLLYMDGHEGRGVGLEGKIHAYSAMDQDSSLDTFAAGGLLQHPDDSRSYEDARCMLDVLGLARKKGLRLLTCNPWKVCEMEELVGLVQPLLCPSNETNASYNAVKVDRVQKSLSAMPSRVQQLFRNLSLSAGETKFRC